MTIKIGSAMIAFVHFNAACLYSGLDVSALPFEVLPAFGIGLEGGAGVGRGLGGGGDWAAGAEARVGVTRWSREDAGVLAAIAGVFAEAEAVAMILALEGKGLATFAVAGAGTGVALTAAVLVAVAFGFSSVTTLEGAFALVTLVFAASAFLAGLTTLSTAAAVALVDAFRVLAGGFFSMGTAAVSFKVTFMACAFLGRVVETCRAE